MGPDLACWSTWTSRSNSPLSATTMTAIQPQRSSDPRSRCMASVPPRLCRLAAARASGVGSQTTPVIRPLFIFQTGLPTPCHEQSGAIPQCVRAERPLSGGLTGCSRPKAVRREVRLDARKLTLVQSSSRGDVPRDGSSARPPDDCLTAVSCAGSPATFTRSRCKAAVSPADPAANSRSPSPTGSATFPLSHRGSVGNDQGLLIA